MSKKKTPLQDQIVLRYRADGHIRFQIPEPLCTEEAAELLEELTGKLEGVYRVIVYRSQGKLSIRYIDTACSFQDVAKHLYKVVDVLAKNSRFKSAKSRSRKESPQGEKLGFKERIANQPWVKWAKDQYHFANSVFQGATAVTRKRLGLPAAPPVSTERMVINFLNDLASFYLIKLHWNKITGLWLKHPIKYRYQWLTAFYLIFLLVRYRKATRKK
jgi:hypothetical protein